MNRTFSHHVEIITEAVLSAPVVPSAVVAVRRRLIGEDIVPPELAEIPTRHGFYISDSMIFDVLDLCDWHMDAAREAIERLWTAITDGPTADPLAYVVKVRRRVLALRTRQGGGW